MNEEGDQAEVVYVRKLRDDSMSHRRCGCHGKLVLIREGRNCICAIYRCRRCRKKTDYLCIKATAFTLSDKAEDVRFGMQMHKDHVAK